MFIDILFSSHLPGLVAQHLLVIYISFFNYNSRPNNRSALSPSASVQYDKPSRQLTYTYIHSRAQSDTNTRSSNLFSICQLRNLPDYKNSTYSLIFWEKNEYVQLPVWLAYSTVVCEFLFPGKKKTTRSDSNRPDEHNLLLLGFCGVSRTQIQTQIHSEIGKSQSTKKSSNYDFINHHHHHLFLMIVVVGILIAN